MSFPFSYVQKAFLLSLRGKRIANILRFLGRRESKLVRKNSKKLPKLFHYGFEEKNFKQKRPECPFKSDACKAIKCAPTTVEPSLFHDLYFFSLLSMFKRFCKKKIAKYKTI